MTSSDRLRGVLIAIDGPAGAGKSTLARDLAAELGVGYVNTGVMYRAVAAAALRLGLDRDDEQALARAAQAIRFELDHGHPAALLVDGAAPGPDLESTAVEASVSAVSRHPAVRAILRDVQRELGRDGAVMEGRDIATVVFPDADLKIFVTAAPEVRAARRRRERGDGEAGDAVEQRDVLDARTNPLEPADGAIVIDSTDLSASEVLRMALDAVAAARTDQQSR